MKSLVFATLATFALVVPAAAQPAGDLYPDLPMASETPIRGVVPGVGPTPGYILEVISTRAKCSQDAIRAADGLMAPQDAVRTCNQAIMASGAQGSDLAGTLVNRGVLLMTMLQPEDAKRDFERALQLDPEAAEALANRGAMKISEGQQADGVADLTRAIELGTERPERAYYNRALGREDLGDVRGAYEDYRMAQLLNPNWDAPATQLARFQVRRAAR